MILYHFTTKAALDSIRKEGLTRGEAPLSARRVVRAVNLTTDPEPSGHGLDCGGDVVTEAHSAALAAAGHTIPAGTAFANKLEARITIVLPSTDPNLRLWRPWARKHCEPDFLQALERSGGATSRKAKTWWLYFGAIPPERIRTIEVLIPDEAD